MNLKDQVSVTSNQSSAPSLNASALKQLGEIISTNPQIGVINGVFSE
jgi:hypothetical protein